jgi:hypothetical protein
MKRLVRYFLLVVLHCFIPMAVGSQGPYAPAAGEPGTSAIPADSSVFIRWASSAVVVRGPKNINLPGNGLASVGDAMSPIGKPGENGIVSLGDGGMVTLSFDKAISDIPGYDFAVFENSFSSTFLELAFVEVSSDGVNFFRFDAVSLTDTLNQVDAFGDIDPTNLYHLAGKYKGGFGTPFDLNDLTPNALLDIQHITHVRIVDVIGTLDPALASRDINGYPINDPWPTDFASSGFDLDAVGVLSPFTGINATQEQGVVLYPNPAKDEVMLRAIKGKEIVVFLTDLYGKKRGEWHFSGALRLDLTGFEDGIYVVHYQSISGYSSTLLRLIRN